MWPRIHIDERGTIVQRVWVIFKRELGGYFTTPIAAVFLVIFLLLSGTFTFYLGNFFGRGQADLRSFFEFHPWLYLVLIPAFAMRLWAEERRGGTIELLFTLPVTLTEAVLGKFLAAWCFTALALFLTFPLWVTVNILGNPDNGVILAGYIGSLLLAGGFLAIGTCMSALTKSQVIAFVVSVVVCLGFVLSGFPLLGLGLVAFERGLMAEARSALERAVSLDPDSGEAWNLLGVVRQRSGDGRDAWRAFTHALDASPFLPPALANAGLIAAQQGDESRAREMLRRLRDITHRLRYAREAKTTGATQRSLALSSLPRKPIPQLDTLLAEYVPHLVEIHLSPKTIHRRFRERTEIFLEFRDTGRLGFEQR